MKKKNECLVIAMDLYKTKIEYITEFTYFDESFIPCTRIYVYVPISRDTRKPSIFLLSSACNLYSII